MTAGDNMTDTQDTQTEDSTEETVTIPKSEWDEMQRSVRALLTDRAERSTNVPVPPGEEKIWIENLMDSPSRFSNSDHKVNLERRGFVGSVLPVPLALSRDPFLKRAEQRGRIRFISDESTATELMAGLHEQMAPEQQSEQVITKALSEEASSANRYAKELSEEGEQRRSITSEQIWGEDSTPRPMQVETVVANPGELDQALPPQDVLTEPIREGDWVTETRS